MLCWMQQVDIVDVCHVSCCIHQCNIRVPNSSSSCMYGFQTIIKLIYHWRILLQDTNILDDLLKIYNHYFEQRARQVYPAELQAYKENSLILNPLFGLGLIHNIVLSKYYDKRDGWMKLFLPPAIISSNDSFFNNTNKYRTAKLLKQVSGLC